MTSSDSPTPASGDPVAVILARMEVKLDNALTEQARHGSRIDKADERIDQLEREMAKVLLAAGFAAAIGAGGGVGLTKLIGG